MRPSMTEPHAVRQRQARGFTLIELLVVIAIIALLVSILLPSLNRAKYLARLVVCLTREKGLATGVVLYSEDHDGQFPASSGGTAYGSWIPPLLENMEGHPADPAANFWDTLRDNELWYCPIPAEAERSAEQRRQNPGWLYSINWWLTWKTVPGTNPLKQIPVRFADLAVTSEAAVIMEGAWRPAPIHTPDFTQALVGLPYYPIRGPVHNRESMNICYADGHAETHTVIDSSNMDDAAFHDELMYNPDYPWTHSTFWGVPGSRGWNVAAYD